MADVVVVQIGRQLAHKHIERASIRQSEHGVHCSWWRNSAHVRRRRAQGQARRRHHTHRRRAPKRRCAKRQRCAARRRHERTWRREHSPRWDSCGCHGGRRSSRDRHGEATRRRRLATERQHRTQLPDRSLPCARNDVVELSSNDVAQMLRECAAAAAALFWFGWLNLAHGSLKEANHLDV